MGNIIGSDVTESRGAVATVDRIFGGLIWKSVEGVSEQIQHCALSFGFSCPTCFSCAMTWGQQLFLSWSVLTSLASVTFWYVLSVTKFREQKFSYSRFSYAIKQTPFSVMCRGLSNSKLMVQQSSNYGLDLDGKSSCTVPPSPVPPRPALLSKSAI